MRTPVVTVLFILSFLMHASCGGSEGTIAVSVVASPDSILLSEIATLQATLSNPRKVVRAERGDQGIELRLAVDSDDQRGTLTLEGFDVEGQLIAVGFSSELPIASVDASITVFMAPPMSVTSAPVSLPEGRYDMGAAAIASSALLAGGRTGIDTFSSALTIYNSISHQLSELAPLPEGVANPVVAPGFGAAAAYVFGGDGAEGQEASAFAFSFRSTLQGELSLLSVPDILGSFSSGAAIAPESYVMGTEPATFFDGFNRAFNVIEPPVNLSAYQSVTVLAQEESLRGLFMKDGAASAILIGAESVDRITIPSSAPLSEGTLTNLDQGRAIWLGGKAGDEFTQSGWVYDPRDFAIREVENLLSTPRSNPALASTDRYLVASGGFAPTGQPCGAIDVIDLSSMTRVTTLTSAQALGSASAVAFSNGQVLVAGGVDSNQEASSALELFTPDLPPE